MTERQADPAKKTLEHRRFLLLQGPQSDFFRRLAVALQNAGAMVEKVNFCGGDVFLWGLTNKSYDYTGTLYEWPEWIGRRFREEGITDLCLYGDWRPLHWEAVQLAHSRGVRVWVFEEGYLRSGFSTLEENGVNGRSTLPVSPAEIHEIAANLPDPTGKSIENDIRDKVKQAILHHFGNVVLWPKFRHYRTHRPQNIFFELLGIIFVKDFLENIFECMVILLRDRIFCCEPQILLCIQCIIKAASRKALYGSVDIMHTLYNT